MKNAVSAAGGRRIRLVAILAGSLAVLATSVPSPAAITLAPFKDKLFAYGKVLGGNADGSFRVIDYSKQRDIDGRDVVPTFRVERRYVDLTPRRQERQQTIERGGRRIAVDVTGAWAGARFAVIFIHGRGGDRRLGSNNWNFGGNFNRMKNLAVRNGGVYVAPSVPSFGPAGYADIRALIDYVSASSPKARIVLACASMGSFVCWHLAESRHAVHELAGMMIMGGATDGDYPRSAAFAARLPIVFSHGSYDPVYPWQHQKALFDAIRRKSPDYPTKFVLFNTGKHGTPVRMTDWRSSLDWIFAVDAARR